MSGLCWSDSVFFCRNNFIYKVNLVFLWRRFSFAIVKCLGVQDYLNPLSIFFFSFFFYFSGLPTGSILLFLRCISLESQPRAKGVFTAVLNSWWVPNSNLCLPVLQSRQQIAKFSLLNAASVGKPMKGKSWSHLSGFDFWWIWTSNLFLTVLVVIWCF